MIEEQKQENLKIEDGTEDNHKPDKKNHPLNEALNENQSILLSEIVSLKQNSKIDWSKMSHKRRWIYMCEEKYEKEIITILKNRPHATFFSERDPNLKNIVKFYVAFQNGIRCPTRKERDLLISYVPFKVKISMSNVYKSMPATSQLSEIIYSLGEKGNRKDLGDSEQDEDALKKSYPIFEKFKQEVLIPELLKIQNELITSFNDQIQNFFSTLDNRIKSFKT